MSSLVNILQDVQHIIQERQQHYGPPAANFAEIAQRWSLTLNTSVTPTQVALCMIDLKMSRLSHNPSHKDSLLDILGYGVCLDELLKGEKERAHAVAL